MSRTLSSQMQYVQKDQLLTFWNKIALYNPIRIRKITTEVISCHGKVDVSRSQNELKDDVSESNDKANQKTGSAFCTPSPRFLLAYKYGHISTRSGGTLKFPR